MSICVVHLVRARNGLEPFRDFLRSYTRNRAGQKHDFLIIFKGFGKGSNISDYSALLHGLDYKSMFIRDWGYDIRSYFAAVKKHDYRYFCFLNSFSIILDHNWLHKLYLHISSARVGLAGATGSCESVYSDLLVMEKMDKPRSLHQRFGEYARRLIYRACFGPFPNYHIRTNAFIISRDLMLKIRYKGILRKLDALRFESGKNSLTQQVMNMGLRVLLVGKNGRGYEKEEWFTSNTFYQGKQENLLVADNKTRFYLESAEEKRKLLSKMAWGDNIIN